MNKNILRLFAIIGYQLLKIYIVFLNNYFGRAWTLEWNFYFTAYFLKILRSTSPLHHIDLFIRIQSTSIKARHCGALWLLWSQWWAILKYVTNRNEVDS
uniref:Uncharacterized protein n=1 Tax=Mus musculus TaxID=10090 RepID=Q3UPN8_MOUSE|nr:unnamed protein product [Mus musculus]